ncbi:MAG TPA: hypothetical protein VFV10_17810 [Gammaproteobacteria bacterium]|nr:hypothetical protein [Gammaproteobacteria bacterium]
MTRYPIHSLLAAALAAAMGFSLTVFAQSGASGGVSAAAAAAGATSAAEETRKASPQGDTWESIAKLPDWSGLWEPTFGGGRGNQGPELTPEYAARLAQYRAAQKSGRIQDTPSANCVPPGLPGIMTQPYPIEFLFTPGKVTVLIEAYSQWRQIFTDGRPHPDSPDPTFNGHSIGHWEGDTLVVDSVGFDPEVPMGGQYGIEHSDEMRIVERMRKNEKDQLEIETTITDPKALAKPWVSKRVYGRHRDWTLAEYVCSNNRNFTTAEGKAGIDLTYEDKTK